MRAKTGRGDDGRYRTSSRPDALRITDEGALSLIGEQPGAMVSVRDVRKVMGHWAYHSLSNRLAFSIFAHVYTWLERYKKSWRSPLWPGARSELFASHCLVPLFYSEHDLALSDLCFSMDA